MCVPPEARRRPMMESAVHCPLRRKGAYLERCLILRLFFWRRLVLFFFHWGVDVCANSCGNTGPLCTVCQTMIAMSIFNKTTRTTTSILLLVLIFLSTKQNLFPLYGTIPPTMCKPQNNTTTSLLPQERLLEKPLLLLSSGTWTGLSCTDWTCAPSRQLQVPELQRVSAVVFWWGNVRRDWLLVDVKNLLCRLEGKDARWVHFFPRFRF